ncbi:hypothetical protein E1293_10890 [Actinomadura darangshiensis]|uniref:ATP-binding protein n=1 Tax=Actinomadura darangshiensis TaxID=705336 RepID=A0A4R5BNV9_9ACTN|nr:hypothetical protein [Actinomadura darangshiensis]TDD85604.1 hypothetical protein E1293_10890 [Actinomadura darangshiensis]
MNKIPGTTSIPPVDEAAWYVLLHDPTLGLVRAAEGLLRAALTGWAIRNYRVIVTAQVVVGELAGKAVRIAQAAGRSDELEVMIRLVRRKEKRYVRVEVFHQFSEPADYESRLGDLTDLDLPAAEFGCLLVSGGTRVWAEVDAAGGSISNGEAPPSDEFWPR